MVKEKIWVAVQNDLRLLKEHLTVLEGTVSSPSKLITSVSQIEQTVLVVLTMIEDLKKINGNLIKARSDVGN
ncbi:MAG: hypothetical protein AABX39_05660 [Nanoarchaeota archaeon]